MEHSFYFILGKDQSADLFHQGLITSSYSACIHAQSLICVQFFVTPWTIAHQAPPSMGFSRQEYWRGLPLPSPGISPTKGQNPHLLCPLHWQAGSLPLSHLGRRLVSLLCLFLVGGRGRGKLQPGGWGAVWMVKLLYYYSSLLFPHLLYML